MSSIAKYDRQTFEPKAAARIRWLDAKGALSGLPVVSTDLISDAPLFLLGPAARVAIVSSVPSRRR